MHSNDEYNVKVTPRQLLIRMFILLSVSLGLSLITLASGFTLQQSVASSVFIAIIIGTLFFWNFRLAVAFLGIGVLIFTRSLNIEHFVKEASLPVILFLVGMMIIVGALRDLGFFTWIVQSIMSIPHMTGRKFVAVTALASALLACMVDEVTSIIFISTLVFQVCNRLKINPKPYIIICVLCTNIGSAGTMLGNPVGIYIGTKAHLSFQDFMIWAFPIMLIALGSGVLITMWWFRRELALFDAHLKERLERNLSLVPDVKVPYGKGLVVLLFTLTFIALHHVIETALGLDPSSVLLVAPLACAGVIMILKRDRARHYVESEVDWWTLLFFLMLFAIAGTLAYTGVTRIMAGHFTKVFGNSLNVLIPAVMFVTALGSAFVDNVVFVAAFAPVIETLGETVHVMPLWWALLFGACIGGNITLIGSTANIVALGMLEKNYKTQISFLQWLKIGALSAFLAMFIAWGMLMLFAPLMPGAH